MLLIETGGYAHGRPKSSLNSVRQTKLMLLNDVRGNSTKSDSVSARVNSLARSARKFIKITASPSLIVTDSPTLVGEINSSLSSLS